MKKIIVLTCLFTLQTTKTMDGAEYPGAGYLGAIYPATNDNRLQNAASSGRRSAGCLSPYPVAAVMYGVNNAAPCQHVERPHIVAIALGDAFKEQKDDENS